MPIEKKKIDEELTFRSGLAISGKMLQNGLITSKNLTGIDLNEKKTEKKLELSSVRKGTLYLWVI